MKNYLKWLSSFCDSKILFFTIYLVSPKGRIGLILERHFHPPNLYQAVYFTKFNLNIIICKGGFSILGAVKETNHIIEKMPNSPLSGGELGINVFLPAINTFQVHKRHKKKKTVSAQLKFPKFQPVKQMSLILSRP